LHDANKETSSALLFGNPVCVQQAWWTAEKVQLAARGGLASLQVLLAWHGWRKQKNVL
jgi:hypothetical protein